MSMPCPDGFTRLFRPSWSSGVATSGVKWIAICGVVDAAQHEDAATVAVEGIAGVVFVEVVVGEGEVKSGADCVGQPALADQLAVDGQPRDGGQDTL